MQTLIFLPTQGPHLPRAGAVEQSDWHEQCRLAAQLQRRCGDAVIYVPSAFCQCGAKSELEFYSEQLRAVGVPADALRLDRQGLDTVEQCELAVALAKEMEARMIVVACRSQHWRVRYLLRHESVEFVVADGTPSAWLRFTNVVLTMLFPIIDCLGLREWWKHRVRRRRESGRQ